MKTDLFCIRISNFCTFIAAAVFSVSMLYAQGEEGRRFSAGLTAMPVFDDLSEGIFHHGYTAKADFGCFLSERWSAHIHMFYFYNADPFKYINAYYRSYGMGPSVRYYVPVGYKWKIFLEGGLAAGLMKFGTDRGEDHVDLTRYNCGYLVYHGGIGADYCLSGKFDFEITLPYIYVDIRTSPTQGYRGLAGPTIGLRYHF